MLCFVSSGNYNFELFIFFTFKLLQPHLTLESQMIGYTFLFSILKFNSVICPISLYIKVQLGHLTNYLLLYSMEESRVGLEQHDLVILCGLIL